MAGTTGVEPATSSVTSLRSSHLNYVPKIVSRIISLMFRQGKDFLILPFRRRDDIIMGKMGSRSFRREFIIVLWAIILTSSYLFFLPRTALLKSFYFKSADLFFRYRSDHESPPGILDNIVIVNVDDATLAKLGQRWPINRNFYAEFLNNISGGKTRPAVVAMDLVFAGKGNSAEEDARLTEAMKNAGNVVIASYLGEEGKLVLPEETFAKSARAVGFISSPRDQDMAVRRAYPFVLLKDGSISYSFVFNTFALASGINTRNIIYDEKASALILPKARNAVIFLNGEDYTVRINYFGQLRRFRTIPFWKTLKPSGELDILKNRIVLVGTDIEMSHDVYPTPLGIMSGIAINANILSSLLANRFPKQIPASLNYIVLFVAALSVGFVTARLHNLKGLLLVMAIISTGFYSTAMLISKDMVFDFFGLSFIAVTSFVSVAAFKHIGILIENARLRKLALTDGLTGLYGFRYFETRLNIEMKRALSQNADLSLVILDVDHFKEINDTYGHDLGNKVLKKVAAIIRKHTRRSDTVARFGGDEFAIILFHSDSDTSGKLAENVRIVIEGLETKWEDKVIKTTISAGVASLRKSGKTTAADLLKAADEALYKAKAAGRNKVSCG